jgi:hypothetical protein
MSSVQFDVDALPRPIPQYLDAHRDRDVDARLALFAADATVADEGETHAGLDAIEAWMRRTDAAFSYTVTPIGAEQTGDDRYTVTQHLEGDFPGGTVDLRFRFALCDGRIAHLVIAP